MQMRKGLNYQVLQVGHETWQIAAVIDVDQALHSGNYHFLDGIYSSRDEASAALEALKSNAIFEHGERCPKCLSRRTFACNNGSLDNLSVILYVCSNCGHKYWRNDIGNIVSSKNIVF